MTAEEKRRLVEMRLEGLSDAEIADRLDVAPSTVRHWKKYAKELGIDVPDGKVARRREFRMPVTPQGVWQMRERAVRARIEGYNSVEAAVESGLRVQDIRINWRAWAEHLGVDLPPAPTMAELIKEIEEEEEAEPAEEAEVTEKTEETIMSKDKSPAEEAVSMLSRVEELLAGYLEGRTVARIVLDVDEDNCCELSVVDDEECGKRPLHLDLRLSTELRGTEDV